MNPLAAEPGSIMLTPKRKAASGPFRKAATLLVRRTGDAEKVSFVMTLDPYPTNETFVGAGHLIHRDNQAINYTASHGCTMLAKSAASPVRTLFVVR